MCKARFANANGASIRHCGALPVLQRVLNDLYRNLINKTFFTQPLEQEETSVIKCHVATITPVHHFDLRDVMHALEASRDLLP